jgi:hypothetical protein
MDAFAVTFSTSTGSDGEPSNTMINEEKISWFGGPTWQACVVAQQPLDEEKISWFGGPTWQACVVA